MKLIEATKWEVKIEGLERSIQLFDENNNKISGKDAYWVGDFDCTSRKLNSLQGAPKVVEGHFDCSYNNLASLQGAPKIVDGNFVCSYNNLNSLQGAPKVVNGNFYCSYNKLNNLDGAPKKVKKDSYSKIKVDDSINLDNFPLLQKILEFNNSKDQLAFMFHLHKAKDNYGLEVLKTFFKIYENELFITDKIK